MLFYFMSKNKKNINNNQFDAARKYVMTWWVASLVKKSAAKCTFC